MNSTSYKKFETIRQHFKNYCAALAANTPSLITAQQKLIDEEQTQNYIVDTSVVYNSMMDYITADNINEIKLILVADNPGTKEQKKENRKYLVGNSGKLAESFFRNNPELKIDFRKNVLILNKTPIHTPRTAQLKTLCKIGGEKIKTIVEQSQVEMVSILNNVYNALGAPIWITGYSEMKRGGVFETYTKELLKASFTKKALLIYRHFSMNQFTIELNAFRSTHKDVSIADVLYTIGSLHRDKILTGQL
jgi:hypothetical protein